MTGIIIGGVILLAAVIFVLLCTAATFKFFCLIKRQKKEDSLFILTERDVDYRGEISDSELTEYTVTSEDGLKLKGYYVNRFPDSKKVVVICHGYLATHHIALQYAPIYLSRGYNVLVFDQRSHGDSEGRYPSYGYFEKRDLKLWVDMLREKLGENCTIGLMGHSLGAGTVLSYPAVDNNIAFIVSDSGYAHLKRFLYDRMRSAHVLPQMIYPFVKLEVKHRCRYNINEVCPIDTVCNEGKNIPILFIHGTGDSVVDYHNTVDMYEKRGNPADMLYLVKGAGHSEAYSANKQCYVNNVNEFLDTIGC